MASPLFGVGAPFLGLTTPGNPEQKLWFITIADMKFVSLASQPALNTAKSNKETHQFTINYRQFCCEELLLNKTLKLQMILLDA